MKKVLLLMLALVMVMLSGCFWNASSIGIIGGSDGPTAIYVDDGDGVFSETEPVKAVKVNGALYYETGEDRDAMPGEKRDFEGTLTKAVEPFEIPKEDGQANFNAKGYITGKLENTIEIPDGDDWEVFIKVDSDDISKYNYIMKIESRDTEYTVLSGSMNITASDIENSDGTDIYVLSINYD